MNSGGKIAFGRVNGSLNLTRSFGDHAHKGNAAIPLADQVGPHLHLVAILSLATNSTYIHTIQSISAMPDVKVVELGAGDDFLVIGCDGIWDSMSSQDVVDFVRHRLQIGRDLTTICTEVRLGGFPAITNLSLACSFFSTNSKTKAVRRMRGAKVV